MPQFLKTYINETTDLKPEEKEGMIWFSCEGENPADKEHIGHIDYLPKPGVPKYHYPYTNQEGYHSPAVFAHFTNPKRKFVKFYVRYPLKSALSKLMESKFDDLKIMKSKRWS